MIPRLYVVFFVIILPFFVGKHMIPFDVKISLHLVNSSLNMSFSDGIWEHFLRLLVLENA